MEKELGAIILPEGVKDRDRLIVQAVGAAVPHNTGIFPGVEVVIKPHTYMVVSDRFKDFGLIDYLDVWGIVARGSDDLRKNEVAVAAIGDSR